MKQTIGLFLSARPEHGGAFQFSQSIMEAVAALPPERFERITAFTEPLWSERLTSRGLAGLALRAPVLKLLSYKRIAGYLPMRWWRTTGIRRLQPLRFLLSRPCDLWMFPAMETFSYLMPVPSVGVIFDLMHRYERQFPEVSSRGLYQVRERHFRRMCRYASGVLVDSEVGKQHVRESYFLSTDQIHVLPFVPPRHIRLSGPEAPCQALPSKFVFYPAQFWMHKNHQRLIQAAALVRQNCPDFHLVLSGSKKNAYAATVAAVKALGLSDNVHFLGYVPDEQMAFLYRKARALIMPTFFGPTNIPPLEAIASGCPVAVSKIYGMPQQLGDAALYFDPTRVAEMASAMEALWTDDGLCCRLISRGLRRAAEWTQDHFNARFGNIVETVLRMNPCGKR